MKEMIIIRVSESEDIVTKQLDDVFSGGSDGAIEGDAGAFIIYDAANCPHHNDGGEDGTYDS